METFHEGYYNSSWHPHPQPGQTMQQDQHQGPCDNSRYYNEGYYYGQQQLPNQSQTQPQPGEQQYPYNNYYENCNYNYDYTFYNNYNYHCDNVPADNQPLAEPITPPTPGFEQTVTPPTPVLEEPTKQASPIPVVFEALASTPPMPVLDVTPTHHHQHQAMPILQRKSSTPSSQGSMPLLQPQPVARWSPNAAGHPIDHVFSDQKIVRCILSNFGISELKRQRYVCQGWNKEICQIFQERVSIRFISTRRMKNYTEQMARHPDLSLRFTFGSRVHIETPAVQNFISTFGVNIVSLEIHAVPLRIDTVIELLMKLPNMERLILPSEFCLSAGPIKKSNDEIILDKLKTITFLRNKDNDISGLKLFVQHILNLVPNIEEVRVKGSNSRLSPDTEVTEKNYVVLQQELDTPSALDLFIQDAVTAPNVVHNLRKLQFQLDPENLIAFTEKKFPLESLDLKVMPNVSPKDLQTALSSVKDSLQKLKIQWVGNANADFSFAEKLPRLQKLHLMRYKGGLGFMDKVPNLSEITLTKINMNMVALKDSDFPQMLENVHRKLQSFRVFHDSSDNSGCNKQRSIQTIQKLGIQFPSLKKLRLEGLIDESLCLIYAQWPNLVELEIVHGQFTDMGTTAIHPNAYKVILREGAYESFNLNALRQGFFIGNLSKLTTLKLHSPKISDVSVILGILSCPNLNSLSIQASQITDASIYRLQKKQTIKKIVTKQCTNVSQEATEFVTKSMKERGGTASLTKCKGGFDVQNIIKFLDRSRKPKVLLKRLSQKVLPIAKPSITKDENQVRERPCPKSKKSWFLARLVTNAVKKEEVKNENETVIATNSAEPKCLEEPKQEVVISPEQGTVENITQEESKKVIVRRASKRKSLDDPQAQKRRSPRNSPTNVEESIAKSPKKSPSDCASVRSTRASSTNVEESIAKSPKKSPSDCGSARSTRASPTIAEENIAKLPKKSQTDCENAKSTRATPNIEEKIAKSPKKSPTPSDCENARSTRASHKRPLRDGKSIFRRFKDYALF